VVPGYGGTRRDLRRSIVAWTAVAVLAAACAGPVDPAPGSPDLADRVPAPAGASEVRPGNRAADGGQPVVGFESPLPPAEALASYRATLAASGFTEVGADGAWHLFSDGTQTLAVRVASSGPPTSIVVRVVTDPAPAVARPSTPATAGPGGQPAPASVGSPAARTAPPTGGGGGTDQIAPTPEPTPKPSASPKATPAPAGPGDAPPGQGGTPPGQGGTPPGQGGTPPGQGGPPPGQGGPGASTVPTPEPPTPSPSAEPSDTPHPTPKPHPTPDPTPKPTPKPKPTPDPTPKPTKTPKP
jgi:hypothetical protein